jgi:uncharacterized membrane protein (UPF0127 family)
VARRRSRVPLAGARLALACLALVAAGGGCDGSSLARPGELPGDATMPPLLAELDLASVGIGSRVLTVGIADTPAERSRGLAGTDDLGPLDGLLFVYSAPVEQSFYMRGVRMPLDIAFVGADRRVLAVLTMPVCAADPCPTYAPPGPFLWALETAAGGLGWVVVGDVVEIAAEDAPE